MTNRTGSSEIACGISRIMFGQRLLDHIPIDQSNESYIIGAKFTIAKAVPPCAVCRYMCDVLMYLPRSD